MIIDGPVSNLTLKTPTARPFYRVALLVICYVIVNVLNVFTIAPLATILCLDFFH